MWKLKIRKEKDYEVSDMKERNMNMKVENN